MAGADALGSSSLAARCTACSTVFRVVQDQLRVSSGWVRCGRCAQVFNAAENLIDLETGAPRRLDLSTVLPGRAPVPATAAATAAATAPAPTEEPAEPRVAVANPVVPAPSGAPFDVSAQAPLEAPPPAEVAAPSPAAEPGIEVAWTGPASVPEPLVESATADAHAAPAEPVVAAGPDAQALAPGALVAERPVEPTLAGPATQPSFVRQADRAARWRQPRVRALLAAGVLGGALLLAAQVALAYRDMAAARWPGLRPWLEAACQPLNCSVGPARLIEALTVESSALVRVERSELYQLTVALRNRATLDLAMPALELSLTDAQGRLLSRRVLRAADFGVAQTSLPAGRDLALQATLKTAAPATPAGSVDSAGGVVGYTIELFYP